MSEEERDVALAYMARFSCIGPLCEDNCCYTWRVDINEPEYERLIDASRLTSAVERKRIRKGFTTIEQNGKKRRIIKLRAEDQCCPFLESDGNCHIHATFGPQLLFDVCTTFPRALHQIGEHLELTGNTSCPEVARKLLLAPDATDIVDFPHEKVSRLVRTGGMDPRDLRPYWRRVLILRDRFMTLLRDQRFSLEQRLFVVAFFAKRTAELLKKETKRLDAAEEKALDGELERLGDAQVITDVARRFENVQPPAMLVLLLARELMRPLSFSRDPFRRMVEAVFANYVQLEAALATDENAAPPAAHVDAIFAEYQRRKTALRARMAARVDQYFANHATDYWMHHLPLAAPELMTHALRQLGQMAVQKFLLYSHPRVAMALEDGRDDAGLQEAVDGVAVEVFFRTARHIEHTPLLTNMEKALDARGLRSLAGAAALVRF